MAHLPFKVNISKMIDSGILPDEILNYVASKVTDELISINKNPDLVIDRDSVIKSFEQERFKNLDKDYFYYFIFKFDFIVSHNIQLIFRYDEKKRFTNFSIIDISSSILNKLNYFDQFPFFNSLNYRFKISFNEKLKIDCLSLVYSFFFINHEVKIQYTNYLKDSYFFKNDDKLSVTFDIRNMSKNFATSSNIRNIDIDNHFSEEKFISFLHYLSAKKSLDFECFNELDEKFKIKETFNNKEESKAFEKFKEKTPELMRIFRSINFEENFKIYKLLKY